MSLFVLRARSGRRCRYRQALLTNVRASGGHRSGLAAAAAMAARRVGGNDLRADRMARAPGRRCPATSGNKISPPTHSGAKVSAAPLWPLVAQSAWRPLKRPISLEPGGAEIHSAWRGLYGRPHNRPHNVGTPLLAPIARCAPRPSYSTSAVAPQSALEFWDRLKAAPGAPVDLAAAAATARYARAEWTLAAYFRLARGHSR